MYENDISKHCKRLNKAIKYVHDTKASIRIPKLDCKSIRIKAYSDAAFVNNTDVSSQLRRIVLLTDDNHNAIPVSYKPRSVACSVLSAEVIPFVDLFDDVLAIHKIFEFVQIQSIPVYILKNYKSLFYIISKRSCTNDKRIMLDIYLRFDKHIMHKKLAKLISSEARTTWLMILLNLKSNQNYTSC